MTAIRAEMVGVKRLKRSGIDTVRKNKASCARMYVTIPLTLQEQNW